MGECRYGVLRNGVRFVGVGTARCINWEQGAETIPASHSLTIQSGVWQAGFAGKIKGHYLKITVTVCRLSTGFKVFKQGFLALRIIINAYFLYTILEILCP